MEGYYDDLSDCSSQANDSESEEEEDEPRQQRQKMSAPQHRCIVHVDVDCFYCQCEMIDRKLPEDRPFAIGQKHIIVTCNYAARRCGVRKLELREMAYAKCPNLIIFEGSDLTRYRIHGRNIYDSFRKACKHLCPRLPVAKGSMDEMMADLTLACHEDEMEDQIDSNVYIYGEQSREQTVLTEDQTGDSVVVVEYNEQRRDRDHRHATVTAQLKQAASLAVRIRASILQETGFRVTMGVSINPLLAKLASGLKKPGLVNLLYPWRSERLLEHLPLRKLHGAGRRTLQVLQPCLVEHFPDRKEPVVWTCRDLRAIPDHEIAACLKEFPCRESSEDQTRVLLLKCIGIDETPVKDDDGGLPKTVSVENSFRRGTVTSREAVMDAVNDVCRRLPDLLHERTVISNNPSLAFPTTLRLTVRLLIDNDSKRAKHGRRRPFETFSRQTTFSGQKMLGMDDSEKRKFLFSEMFPMVRALILDRPFFDVTRLNLGVTNFHDLEAGSNKSAIVSNQKQSIPSQSVSCAKSSQTQLPVSLFSQAMNSSRTPSKELVSVVAKRSPPPDEVKLRASDIDPAVLEELPPDIRAQIRRSLAVTPASRKKTRIDDFFLPKKK